MTITRERSREHARASWPWVLGPLLLFALTNVWLTWRRGVEHVMAEDVAWYVRMASAAPGVPDMIIGSAYTDRFAVHWSAGTVSALTGLEIPVTYRVLWLLVSLGIVASVWAVLVRLGVRGPALGLCIGLLVLNPYAFRFYAVVPGMLADLVFELGLAIAVLGLVSRRYAVLLAGVVVAVLARQTTLVVLPVLAVWLVLQEPRPRARPAVLTRAAVLLVVPFFAYLAVRRVTADFTDSFSPRIPEDTILPLLVDLPGSAGTLVGHGVRVVAPLAVLLGLLCVAALVRYRSLRAVPVTAWLCLAVAAAVVAQPLGIGPSFPGFSGNQPRLSALGVVPLVLCLGALLAGADLGRSLRARWAVPVLAAVVVLASLHHLYTRFGPGDVSQFLVLQVVAALASAVLLGLLLERRDGRLSAPDEPAVARRV